MQLLLPPSEGKNWPESGSAISHRELYAASDLTQHREDVAQALIKLSAHPDALRTLKVSAGLQEVVTRNLEILTAPVAPAHEIYTGVLYDAAQLGQVCTSDPEASLRVLIFSALYGVLRPTDQVAGYRLSGGVDLPGIGHINTSWRRRLQPVLDQAHADELIVDCRSGTYQNMWHPGRSENWVAVRVLQEVNGVRKVVSHHAKYTRGLLTKHLLTRPGPMPQSPTALLDATSELIGGPLLDVALVPQRRGPVNLELVIK